MVSKLTIPPCSTGTSWTSLQRFGPSCSTEWASSVSQGHDADASCTDSQRTAAYPKLATAKPGYSPRQDQFGASILHTLVQNRHLIIRKSCPTGHCEKVGKMVMSACLPITGICASLTLEIGQIGGELVSPDNVESRHTDDLGWSRPNFL